ncbi:hypothetical protein E2C01_023196 [Portunus trituberculatus]|uniref:Uncharacterized protein n=1 Tax=Portunus trituberculatus TaxID=210409 RepID=A0A5B7E7D3_PORTR|nr:hypothetical protein [Portunus trituberculatus]
MSQAVRTELKEEPLKTQRHHPARLEKKNPLKVLEGRRQKKAGKRQRMENPPVVKAEDGREQHHHQAVRRNPVETEAMLEIRFPKRSLRPDRPPELKSSLKENLKRMRNKVRMK